MALSNGDGRLLPATVRLLSAVSGVDRALLASCVVRSSKQNLMCLPWFRERNGGGALVYGATIIMTRNFFHHARGHELRQDRATLMLLAHEVGHLAQFARFRGKVFGSFRAAAWAIGVYVGSFLRHGGNGYRLASIEQDAERGRWVLRHLLCELPQDQSNALMRMLEHDDEPALEQWLENVDGRLKDLHSAYPGW